MANPTQKDRDRYMQQRYNATKNRKLVFNITFEEWWDWWQATGHYHERGRKLGQYCMSRIGDTGPYELGNIFCQLQNQNSIEAHTGRVFTKERRDKISKASSGSKKTVNIKKCPHCGKEGASNNMKRWHFDNCKEFKS